MKKLWKHCLIVFLCACLLAQTATVPVQASDNAKAKASSSVEDVYVAVVAGKRITFGTCYDDYTIKKISPCGCMIKKKMESKYKTNRTQDRVYEISFQSESSATRGSLTFCEYSYCKHFKYQKHLDGYYCLERRYHVKFISKKEIKKFLKKHPKYRYWKN